MNGNVCLHFPATGQWKLICLRAIFNHPGRAEPCSESAPLLRSPPPHATPHLTPRLSAASLQSQQVAPQPRLFPLSSSIFLFLCFVARHQAQFRDSKCRLASWGTACGRSTFLVGFWRVVSGGHHPPPRSHSQSPISVGEKSKSQVLKNTQMETNTKFIT